MHLLAHCPVDFLPLVLRCKDVECRGLELCKEFPNKCVVCLCFCVDGVNLFLLDLHLVAVSYVIPLFALECHSFCFFNQFEGVHFSVWLESAEDDAKDCEAAVFLLASVGAGPSVEFGLQFNRASSI